MIPTSKFPLGRNPSPLDSRDYKLADFEIGKKLAAEPLVTTVWPFLAAPLDQGDTPHCVGFGGADFGINNPIQDNFTNQDGHDIYWKCKVVDGEPGMQNGSSVRSLAKVLRDMGIIKNYAFAHTINEINYWLMHKGPMIMGTDWTEGMCYPDADNLVHITGEIIGGHCFCVNEIYDNGEYNIQNSWDNYWGINGRAHITISDFQKIFANGGEALAAVEIDKMVSNNDGCLAALLRLFKSM